jgi:hypothetical protein
MRFTRTQLEAIVDEARYSDPRAAAYMVDTLVARQRATGRYWFDRVAPLDAFAAAPDGTGFRLCFTDLARAYELDDATTRYRVDAFDHAGAANGEGHVAAPGASGLGCTSPITPGTAHDGYTIVRLQVERGTRSLPPVFVHVARGADGAYRVIGIRRE